MEDRDNPYSPPDAPARHRPTRSNRLPAKISAAYVVAGCLALPFILYVGSFVWLFVDDVYGWKIVARLDNQTKEALGVFYAPQLMLYVILTGAESL